MVEKMNKIQILIVEDELIIAEDMKGMLHKFNYEVVGIASDCAEAENILSQTIPDIILIDIQLRGNDNGIKLAGFIRERYNIPIIFITSYADASTVEKAKQIKPDGYIVKPFAKEDLFTAIEIAVFNYANKRSSGNLRENDDWGSVVIRDSIFIRKDYMLIKIKFDDLIWIKSELNYLELYCIENKHLVRSTLKEFVDKLPSGSFLQIHKSYCINIKYITAIDHSSVWLKKIKIPIGRSYLEKVKNILKLEI
jgi:DNA-binding LytR/AlgR family response regulator